ncbi:substrate-binding domain-containing protein [Streptosporangium lutulentum]
MLSFPLDRDRISTVAFGAGAASEPDLDAPAVAGVDAAATGSPSGIDPDASTFRVTRQRLRGFRDAWSETGGEWSRVRVAVCSTNSAREAEALATELLTGPDSCDAIAAMSDELALGTLRAAARLGLAVPGDVTVSGWDDTDAASPAELTTVAQSLRDQGARCARTALGHPAPTGRDAEIAWHLISRASTHRR